MVQGAVVLGMTRVVDPADQANVPLTVDADVSEVVTFEASFSITRVSVREGGINRHVVELCSALGWDLNLPRLSSYVSRARPVRSGPYCRFPESQEPSSHGRPASLTIFHF